MVQQEMAIEMRHVNKSFSGISAVKDVDLQIRRNTIHALIGENGAGKSTLMKMLCGIIRMDSGTVKLMGKEVKIKSLIEAQSLKLAIVPQELAVVKYFTVAENLYLGREPRKNGLINRRKMYDDAEELLEKLKIKLDPHAIVSDLSVSEEQMLVIAKVLSLDAEVIIMDEPTARLGAQEIDDFLKYMRYLCSIGKTVIYISHKLEEIFAVCDEITVLRDGCVVGRHLTSDITQDQLISEMVNRSSELLNINKEYSEHTEEILRAEHICGFNQVNNASFTLYKGEILGFYGLVGAGRTEMIRAILGIDKMKSGTVVYKGVEVAFKNIRESMNAGLILVPEERRRQGLVMNMAIRQNTTLPKLRKYSKLGILNQKKEIADAEKLRDELQLACASIENPADSLSGGNQQKVVLSKFIDMPVDVFIFDEPTRGIDVGAKSEIYTLIRRVSERGASVIIISSEIPEIQSICDRVAVMKEGEVIKTLGPEEFSNAETILKYSIGG